METNRKQNSKMHLKELPGEIIELILSKLPFFNLPSCRMVCKSWNELVLTCKFDAPKPSINSNLVFAQISSPNNLRCLEMDVDGDKNQQGIRTTVSPFISLFRISNSCNGLLFGSSCLQGSICIWNPMTNELLQLPSEQSNPEYEYKYALGFNRKSKQYKIVRRFEQKGARLVEILTIGTRTRTRTSSDCEWACVTTSVPFEFKSQATYFNGALYWIGSHPQQLPNVVFRFDLDGEKFQETPFAGSPPAGNFFGVLGVFQDALYLSTNGHEVWKLEQDSSSWVKVFRGPFLQNISHLRSYYILIKVYEDGKILLAHGPIVILYDPVSGTLRILKNKPEIDKYYCVYQLDSCSFDSLHKILA